MIPRVMKLLLLILFTAASFIGFSQEFESVWSSAIANVGKEVPYKLFPNSDSGYTLIKKNREQKNVVFIDVLDSNNTILLSRRIQIQGDKIIAVEQVNEKITLFSIFHNNEKKEDELSAHTINSKGELSETTLIASLKSNGGYLASYKISVSPDGQKVGVVCEKPYVKEKNEELVIKILDKGLQATLTKNYSYTFPSAKRKFNVPFINDKGSLYIVKRSRVKASNKYFITLIKESGFEEHHGLKLRNMRIADISGAFTKEGELILSGFYAGYSRLNFEGAFSFKFNESVSPVYRKEFMLPENLVLGLKTKKEISKFGPGLDKFHIKKIMITDNGSSYLVAEHRVVVKTEKETTETRKGLAIIKFSNKGDFLWAAPVASNQVDNKSRGYWSSSIIIGNEKNLYVIYNPVGEGVKKPESIYGTNALLGTKISKIDMNGAVNNKLIEGLFGSLPEGVIMSPRTYYFSMGKLIIIAENKTRDKLYLGNLSVLEK